MTSSTSLQLSVTVYLIVGDKVITKGKVVVIWGDRHQAECRDMTTESRKAIGQNLQH